MDAEIINFLDALLVLISDMIDNEKEFNRIQNK